jgi:hypothetical protein
MSVEGNKAMVRQFFEEVYNYQELHLLQRLGVLRKHH